VDVPNATLMIIEDAGGFGLTQLHQLRGRVGRGSRESWCFLVDNDSTPQGQERLRTLAAVSDGFELAKKDLEMRGTGQLLGMQQSGMMDARVMTLMHDTGLMALSRQIFEKIWSDPQNEVSRAEICILAAARYARLYGDIVMN